ncbi:MAG: BON domain-containing protein [Planctomycetes bacterium]|nr:BON domain-containing protein [Planctomycetota bacterium]
MDQATILKLNAAALRRPDSTKQNWRTNGTVDAAKARIRASPYYFALTSVRCEHYEGLLALRGQVTSYYLKQQAQEAVRGLDGVDAIFNDLEVMQRASSSSREPDSASNRPGTESCWY